MATITCETSIPLESVIWFKEDQPVTESERFEIVEEGTKHSLIIKDITLMETAAYSVEIGHERHLVTNLIVEG